MKFMKFLFAWFFFYLPVMSLIIIIAMSIIILPICLLAEVFPPTKYITIGLLIFGILWAIWLGDYLQNKKFQKMMNEYHNKS